MLQVLGGISASAGLAACCCGLLGCPFPLLGPSLPFLGPLVGPWRLSAVALGFLGPFPIACSMPLPISLSVALFPAPLSLSGCGPWLGRGRLGHHLGDVDDTSASPRLDFLSLSPQKRSEQARTTWCGILAGMSWVSLSERFSFPPFFHFLPSLFQKTCWPLTETRGHCTKIQRKCPGAHRVPWGKPISTKNSQPS